MNRTTALDVSYHVPGRKKALTRSTKATSDFLALVHQQYPNETIAQLRGRITNRSYYLPNPEAIQILDEHIKAGYGTKIPNWI